MVLSPIGLDSSDNRQLLNEGVTQIPAVTGILQGNARIKFDCHARFHPFDAYELIEKMDELDDG